MTFRNSIPINTWMTSWRSKRCGGGFFLILACLTRLGGQAYFGSDSSGNALAPLEGPDGGEWVLRVEETPDESIRTLLHEGEERKRWEIQQAGGPSDLRREAYYFEGRLREVSRTNPAGRLVEEELYDPEGELLYHRRYILDDRGVPRKVLFLGADGAEERSFSLLYDREGSLRGMTGGAGERIDRMAWRSSDKEEAFFDRVSLEEGGEAYRYEYSRGALVMRLRFREGEEIERILYRYDDEGRLELESLWNRLEQTAAERRYDIRGRLVRENRYREGILTGSVFREYRGERLVLSRERSGRERIRWEYAYSEGETEPRLSRLYRNGELVKEILREGDRNKEILYREGRVIRESFPEIDEEGDDS